MIRILIASLLASIFSTASHAQDFDCSGARYLVDVFSDGVDEIYHTIVSNPEDFVLDTIDRWECGPDPLDMELNGRRYVESLACAYTTDPNSRARISDAEFARAGQTFQRNIAAFSDCFEGEVLTEAPVSYSNETRGEGIIMILNRSVHGVRDRNGRRLSGYRVMIKYGYFQARPRTPLYWEVEVSATHPDGPQNASPGSVSGGWPGGRSGSRDDRPDRQQSRRLYCCDAYGNKYCPITVNPGPVGSPCWCSGVPGTGQMCR